MLSIILTVAVLCAASVGVYYYIKHKSAVSSEPKQLTAAEQAALQVTFPQMTTNLETDGLIQFTMTLQASDNKTKDEISQMIPDIQDIVNRTMLSFSANDLKQVSGFDKLKKSILTAVNSKLLNGSVTNIYFSQIVIQ